MKQVSKYCTFRKYSSWKSSSERLATRGISSLLAHSGTAMAPSSSFYPVLWIRIIYGSGSGSYLDIFVAIAKIKYFVKQAVSHYLNIKENTELFVWHFFESLINSKDTEPVP
jgi:hypothetical protein